MAAAGAGGRAPTPAAAAGRFLLGRGGRHGWGGVVWSVCCWEGRWGWVRGDPPGGGCMVRCACCSASPPPTPAPQAASPTCTGRSIGVRRRKNTQQPFAPHPHPLNVKLTNPSRHPKPHRPPKPQQQQQAGPPSQRGPDDHPPSQSTRSINRSIDQATRTHARLTPSSVSAARFWAMRWPLEVEHKPPGPTRQPVRDTQGGGESRRVGRSERMCVTRCRCIDALID